MSKGGWGSILGMGQIAVAAIRTSGIPCATGRIFDGEFLDGLKCEGLAEALLERDPTVGVCEGVETKNGADVAGGGTGIIGWVVGETIGYFLPFPNRSSISFRIASPEIGW